MPPRAAVDRTVVARADDGGRAHADAQFEAAGRELSRAAAAMASRAALRVEIGTMAVPSRSRSVRRRSPRGWRWRRATAPRGSAHPPNRAVPRVRPTRRPRRHQRGGRAAAGGVRARSRGTPSDDRRWVARYSRILGTRSSERRASRRAVRDVTARSPRRRARRGSPSQRAGSRLPRGPGGARTPRRTEPG